MIQIRSARPSDAAALWAAEVETARTPGLLNSQPEELEETAFAERIAALGPEGAYVVAEEEGRLVGHASLAPLAPRRRDHVRSLDLVVHPGCRGRGVGRTLLEHLVAWAAARRDVEKVELAVRAGNEAAQRLYRRLGFVEEGRLRRRLRLPDGSFEDDLVMALFPREQR